MAASPIRSACLLLGLALLAAGCATPGYRPPPYQAAQDRFGSIALPAAARIGVCPVIDKLSPECRKRLAPEFTPWTYVTEAIEAELRASGLSPFRPAFEFGPAFVDLQGTVKKQGAPAQPTVYLGTELLWLSRTRWILDAELISPKGEVLFAKRGLCAIWSGEYDEQKIVHMTLRQILADPKFKAALP